jgi:hypothetical protein
MPPLPRTLLGLLVAASLAAAHDYPPGGDQGC